MLPLSSKLNLFYFFVAALLSQEVRLTSCLATRQAIRICEDALSKVNVTFHSLSWVLLKCTLARAYSQRAAGKRTHNIEKAIMHFEEATTVYTRGAHTKQWGLVRCAQAELFEDACFVIAARDPDDNATLPAIGPWGINASKRESKRLKLREKILCGDDPYVKILRGKPEQGARERALWCWHRALHVFDAARCVLHAGGIVISQSYPHEISMHLLIATYDTT